MIENAPWEAILETASDFSTIAEFYPSGSTPTADGFDPADAVARYSAVDDLEFMGFQYKRLVQKFGNVSTSMDAKVNNASVTFSNVSREAAAFNFSGDGFEGLIMVLRLVSRSQSTSLSLSQILFTGRCERPLSGDKESLTVTAKEMLGSMDVVVPRRTFGPEDFKGRVSTDPKFEGFIHIPQSGTTTYPRRVRRGGLFGWWNKKQELATIQWSSYSDIDAKRAVPECFGVVQIMAVNIGNTDVGTQLRGGWAFCEGPIRDIVNARSTDPAFPLNATSYVERYGLVGTLNGPNDPSWPTPGYYSRTAHIRGQADNSAVDVHDPPPDIVAVIEGKIITSVSGTWEWNTEVWTDNGADVWRHFLTDPDYFNLDANWIDDTFNVTTWAYNREQIFNATVSDVIYLEEE